MQDFQTYPSLLADIPSDLDNYFSPTPQPTYPDFDTFKIKRKSDGQIEGEADNAITNDAPIDANRVDEIRRAMLIRRRRRRRFRPAAIHLSDRLNASA